MKCILNEPEENGQEREMNLPSGASIITMSPTGDRALAEINNDIYVVTIPKTGKQIISQLPVPMMLNSRPVNLQRLVVNFLPGKVMAKLCIGV